ncbi:hypothetical protein ACFW93_34925 [Streptomyces canus]|uniref:hypothetical protein n=1 Tax=Streptomyces canus TaxID=58343 RepID=UPI0036B21591
MGRRPAGPAGRAGQRLPRPPLLAIAARIGPERYGNTGLYDEPGTVMPPVCQPNVFTARR